ncbi:hypothetical protein [Candidatus Spongiihabitans sp.]|uniref:hypothetical protein n=1 Tax=Candidatus Spongiihabitans sp. TaxID=3101308 RepID=UPI003C799AD0
MEVLNDIACFVSERWNEIWPVFLAIFFGAWSALQFQKSWEKSKQITYELRSGKRAQFALMSQHQVLISLNKQYLSEWRDDSDRHLKLHPLTASLEFQKVDIDSLLYILDTNDPDLLNEVMVAQQSFQTAMGVLEKRNKYHTDFQQRAAKIGDAALDKATVAILGDMTNHLYTTYEDALRLNKEAAKKLEIYLKDYVSLKKSIHRKFSKRKTLRYEEK